MIMTLLRLFSVKIGYIIAEEATVCRVANNWARNFKMAKVASWYFQLRKGKACNFRIWFPFIS